MDDLERLKIYRKKQNAVTEHSTKPGMFERIKEEFTMDADDLRQLDIERAQRLKVLERIAKG